MAAWEASASRLPLNRWILITNKHGEGELEILDALCSCAAVSLWADPEVWFLKTICNHDFQALPNAETLGRCLEHSAVYIYAKGVYMTMVDPKLRQ